MTRIRNGKCYHVTQGKRENGTRWIRWELIRKEPLPRSMARKEAK